MAMKSFNEYLEDIRWEKRLKQYELAKILGVSEGAISKYLKGEDVPEDDKCVRLAEFNGDDPHLVLAIARGSRAKDLKVKNLWEDMYEVIKKASNFIIVLAILFLIASTAEATSFSKVPFPIRHLDIMSNWRKRRSRPLTFSLA